MITLELTEKEAEQLLLCIQSGLVVYENQLQIKSRFGQRMLTPEDRGFLRRFRSRTAKRLLKETQAKLEQHKEEHKGGAKNA